MSTKPANQPAPKLEEVTLLKPHTHEGEPKQTGDKIKVNETDKEWLIKHEVIAAASAN